MAQRRFHQYGPGLGGGELHDEDAKPVEEEPTVGHELVLEDVPDEEEPSEED